MLKDIKQKIMDSIENLVTLEIVTAVGPINPGEKKGEPSDPLHESDPGDPFKNVKRIVTEINLLQGDTRTMYDEEFVTGKYQSIRALHTDKEKEGYNIVMKNIEVLERLLKLATVTSADTSKDQANG